MCALVKWINVSRYWRSLCSRPCFIFCQGSVCSPPPDLSGAYAKRTDTSGLSDEQVWLVFGHKSSVLFASALCQKVKWGIDCVVWNGSALAICRKQTIIWKSPGIQSELADLNQCQSIIQGAARFNACVARFHALLRIIFANAASRRRAGRR